jgi:hypothetical protein
MEEKKSVQLEFRPAEGPAGETGLVITEQQEAPQRGPDGRFLEGNKAGSKKPPRRAAGFLLYLYFSGSKGMPIALAYFSA